MSIDRVVTPVELYRLPLRGAYEMGIVSLVYKFGEKGLIMSNRDLAEVFSTQKRTVEKVISRLTKGEYIRAKDTSNGKRCLVSGTALITVVGTALSTVGVPPWDTQTTALSDDHKVKKVKKTNNTSTPPKTEPTKPDPSKGFDEFWAAYPRKVGKKTAQQSWKAVCRTGPPLAEILKAIETQKKSRQWRERGGEFIPHPTTWLNRGGWDDQLQPAELDPLEEFAADEDEVREILREANQ